jgi:hypothetical protein
MDHMISKSVALPGVQAVYRNGELIYRQGTYQGDTGVEEDGNLTMTRSENRNDRR